MRTKFIHLSNTISCHPFDTLVTGVEPPQTTQRIKKNAKNVQTRGGRGVKGFFNKVENPMKGQPARLKREHLKDTLKIMRKKLRYRNVIYTTIFSCFYVSIAKGIKGKSSDLLIVVVISPVGIINSNVSSGECIKFRDIFRVFRGQPKCCSPPLPSISIYPHHQPLRSPNTPRSQPPTHLPS